MRFVLEFDMSTKAFQTDPRPEMLSILEQVQLAIAEGAVDEIIKDINGITVGMWRITF